MKLFQLFTFIIATVVFIGLFIYCAVTFYSGKQTLFPPDMAPCPDNWKMNSDGTCKIPSPGMNTNLGYLAQTGRPIYVYNNIKTGPKYSYLASYYDIATDNTYQGQHNPKLPLGYYTQDIPNGYDVKNPQKGSIDFTDQGWASYGDPYCAIKSWAKTQNIQWDGMLSYNNSCE
jgi:hypothetical protein